MQFLYFSSWFYSLTLCNYYSLNIETSELVNHLMQERNKNHSFISSAL